MKYQTDNEVMGYLNDYSIVRNEWGDLFYIQVPNRFLELGETVLQADLSPISSLPADLRQLALEKWGDTE